MKKYKAVIDTNVLYAGLYSASGASYQILHLIDKARIVPYLSTSLVFEYEEILRRNQKQLRLSDQDIEDVLDNICSRGEQRLIHFLWRPQLSDPKDDHIELDGAHLWIDPAAMLYLLGTQMDFEVTKLRTGFVFNNPNQSSACGCGESVELQPADLKELAEARGEI